MKPWLERWWPRLVAAGVVLVVLAPAAVASYLHARRVVARHDETMAPWLPITTDGMLLAALVVIWARRATRDPAGRWVWLAFWLGGVVTVAANLAAVLPTNRLSLAVEAVVVAVWPPVTVAITLELAMLLAMSVVGWGKSYAGGDLNEPYDIPEDAAPPADTTVGDSTPPNPQQEPAEAPTVGVVALHSVPDPTPVGGVEDDLPPHVARLLAAGAGRRRLVKEGGLKEHEARRLLDRRNGARP